MEINKKLTKNNSLNEISNKKFLLSKLKFLIDESRKIKNINMQVDSNSLQ